MRQAVDVFVEIYKSAEMIDLIDRAFDNIADFVLASSGPGIFFQSADGKGNFVIINADDFAL